jgi:hypothetical protein
MTRLPRGVPALVAVLSLTAFAAGPAEAKVKRHHMASKRHVATSAYNFPNYVDRGSDRNPGGDNLYFTDTKSPGDFVTGPTLIGPGWFQRWW